MLPQKYINNVKVILVSGKELKENGSLQTQQYITYNNT